MRHPGEGRDPASSRELPLRLPPYAVDRETLENEVRIDTYRASGPGGQHVNKTNSAIRLTHLPSGVVVIAQDSSSQFRNKNVAFERLIEKLAKLNHVPKKRFATKPTRASKERRIEAKKTRAVVKGQRGRKIPHDE
jgi:protein subunit release factor A